MYHPQPQADPLLHHAGNVESGFHGMSLTQLGSLKWAIEPSYSGRLFRLGWACSLKTTGHHRPLALVGGDVRLGRADHGSPSSRWSPASLATVWRTSSWLSLQSPLPSLFIVLVPSLIERMQATDDMQATCEGLPGL